MKVLGIQENPEHKHDSLQEKMAFRILITELELADLENVIRNPENRASVRISKTIDDFKKLRQECLSLLPKKPRNI